MDDEPLDTEDAPALDAAEDEFVEELPVGRVRVAEIIEVQMPLRELDAHLVGDVLRLMDERLPLRRFERRIEHAQVMEIHVQHAIPRLPQRPHAVQNAGFRPVRAIEIHTR